jgi:hypothetical protein
MACKAFLRRYLLPGCVRARLDDQTAGTDARLGSLNATPALHANSIRDLALFCTARPRWTMGLPFMTVDNDHL